jgi:site-specific recombinase XerD
MSNRKPSAYSIPPAGKVSALRQRMIDDMTVRNLAPNTILCYLKQVHYLARYFRKSPDRLSPADIREYQLYLAQDRKVSVNSRLVAMTALRFLYGVTLQRERFIEMLPMPRKEHYLPVILSPAEVLRFLEAAPSFTHRVIFSTMYGTGMRVSEAVHLRMRHIDSHRMMIRIEQSKGNRDRDVPLSPKLLELLRTYWRKVRPQEWLFPGQNPEQPLGREAVGQAVTLAARRAGLTKKPSPHCRTKCSNRLIFSQPSERWDILYLIP